MNCESVPGKTGSLSVSSYSSHSMMAIHCVPLRPPQFICIFLFPPFYDGNSLCPPEALPLPPLRGLALLGGLTPDDLEARRYRHALPRRLPYQLPVTRILYHRLLDPAPQVQDDLASGLVSVAGPRP